jgi:hypothetical protein
MKNILLFFFINALNSMFAQNKVVDSTLAKWINDGITKRSTDSALNRQMGGRFEYYMPKNYEAYCKILHPFTIDLNASDSLYNQAKEEMLNEQKYDAAIKSKLIKRYNIKNDSLLRLDTKALSDAINKIIIKKYNLNDDDVKTKPLKEFPKDVQKEFRDLMEVIMGDDFVDLLSSIKNPIHERDWKKVTKKKNVTWEEVSKKYGLTFHNQMSSQSFSNKFKKIGYPINLWFPFTELPENKLKILSKLIKQISNDKEVYWGDGYRVNKCSIDSIVVKNYDNFEIVGGYIFDSSHQWLLRTDSYRDLDVTLFAGTKKMVEFFKKSGLEIIDCTPETRVDWNADNINKD